MVLLNTAHYKESNEKRKAFLYIYIYISVLEGLLNILTASSMMRDLWETCIYFSLFFYLNIIGGLYQLIIANNKISIKNVMIDRIDLIAYLKFKSFLF